MMLHTDCRSLATNAPTDIALRFPGRCAATIAIGDVGSTPMC